ncbi:unnamed protein product [marine sediment metagenome]|uniref:Uncharacterized protein n=1 Tax=marine sediment metagenome TaxID=412755 RepID=X1ATM1_9ZZZZ
MNIFLLMTKHVGHIRFDGPSDLNGFPHFRHVRVFPSLISLRAVVGALMLTPR